MFMHSWNVKILAAVGLIIIQVIIYMVVMGRDSFNFTIPTFIICSLPGLIGAFILWLEKERGRF
jgi:hypothetical protein